MYKGKKCSIAEVAYLAGCTPDTVRTIIKKGESVEDFITRYKNKKLFKDAGLIITVENAGELYKKEESTPNGFVCMTLEEVGKEMGVTRERIRQTEALALKKLKVLFEHSYPELVENYFISDDCYETPEMQSFFVSLFCEEEVLIPMSKDTWKASLLKERSPHYELKWLSEVLEMEE